MDYFFILETSWCLVWPGLLKIVTTIIMFLFINKPRSFENCNVYFIRDFENSAMFRIKLIFLSYFYQTSKNEEFTFISHVVIVKSRMQNKFKILEKISCLCSDSFNLMIVLAQSRLVSCLMHNQKKISQILGITTNLLNTILWWPWILLFVFYVNLYQTNLQETLTNWFLSNRNDNRFWSILQVQIMA